MHPDQQYDVRKLQHADLAAAAERERLLQQVAPATGARILRNRRVRALLGGAAGAGVALLAATLMLPWGAPASAAYPRAANRIFADEARYVPSIEEYLAIQPEAPGQVLLARTSDVAGALPAGGTECRVLALPGLALCAPLEGASSAEGARVLRQGGPR